jgi:hypothetical protein
MHAERELKLNREYHGINDSLLNEFHDEIISLCDKFGNSGQSGGSAPYYAKAISKAVEDLCMFKNLSPLMGDDREWNDIREWNQGSSRLQQNNRVFSVFKEDGKVYYLDAIIFKDQNGSCFSGSVGDDKDRVYSRQYVKSFPFEPKTFYVDVISIEYSDPEGNIEKKGGSWFEYEIKDDSQLIPVFEYYEQYIKD